MSALPRFKNLRPAPSESIVPVTVVSVSVFALDVAADLFTNARTSRFELAAPVPVIVAVVVPAPDIVTALEIF